MNNIVVPSGYMGSGSSAITDLVSGLDGFNAPNSSYEYVFLHCPGGLFDLEDKLLIGNNSIRSDEALQVFEDRMLSLFKKKNFWVGSYNHFVSPHFMEYIEEFIGSIVTEQFDSVYWYYQEEPTNMFMQLMLYARRLLTKVSGGTIRIQKPLRYNHIRVAFPTNEEFYSSAKKLLNRVFTDLGINDASIIMDQLMLPHNLYRINNYFDDNIRVFVVDRDPRDVFILNKYVWSKNNVAVPYPLDASRFCDYYKRLRCSEKIIIDEKIMRIHFEDLIYNYDTSLRSICSFLDASDTQYNHTSDSFDPEKSIKNTQMFKIFNSNYVHDEIGLIESKLQEYLYDFPSVNILRNGIADSF